MLLQLVVFSQGIFRLAEMQIRLGSDVTSLLKVSAGETPVCAGRPHADYDAFLTWVWRVMLEKSRSDSRKTIKSVVFDKSLL